MKLLFYFTAILLMVLDAFSQCEQSFYPTEKAKTWEITNYNRKDKEQGKTINTVAATEKTDEGFVITIDTEYYDEDGEKLTSGNFEVLCINDKIEIDLQNFIPNQMLEAYENMKVTYDGDNLEFPTDLSAGQDLPNAKGSMTVVVSEGAMGMETTTEFLYKDRKVEGSESIETPAGTFDAMKISQTIETTVNMVGIKNTTSFSSVSWIAEGYGMIKSESYNKKGKLVGYSVLTSFGE